VNDRLKDATLSFWEPYYGELTEADAQEIVTNISGFFRILDRWDKKAKEVEIKPLATTEVISCR
jgi:hypothetical protein